MLRTFLAAMLLLFLQCGADAIVSCSSIPPICVDQAGQLHEPNAWVIIMAQAQAREQQRRADWKEMNDFLRRLKEELDRGYYEGRFCPQSRPPE